MKRETHAMYIPVVLPFDDYGILMDLLGTRRPDLSPSAALSAAIRRFVEEERNGRSLRRSEPPPPPKPPATVAANDVDWSDDWVAFGDPPPAEKSGRRKARAQTVRMHGGDWCVGSDCPSAELLSL